jgi:hypothetical protein
MKVVPAITTTPAAERYINDDLDHDTMDNHASLAGVLQYACMSTHRRGVVSISAGLCLLGPFQELVTGENTHQLRWLAEMLIPSVMLWQKKILKLSGNFRLLAKCT